MIDVDTTKVDKWDRIARFSILNGSPVFFAIFGFYICFLFGIFLYGIVAGFSMLVEGLDAGNAYLFIALVAAPILLLPAIMTSKMLYAAYLCTIAVGQERLIDIRWCWHGTISNIVFVLCILNVVSLPYALSQSDNSLALVAMSTWVSIVFFCVRRYLRLLDVSLNEFKAKNHLP